MTSGIDLSIGASGSFKIQNINFSRQPNGHTNLTATGGIIAASLGHNSKIALADGDLFFLDDGSSANLIDPQMVFGGDMPPGVTIGANSSLSVVLRDGQFAFGSGGTLQVAAGKFDAQLQGLWSTSHPNPAVTATLQNVLVEIASGALHPNANTTLLLGPSSQLSATELTLTPAAPALAGKLTSLGRVDGFNQD